MNYKGLIIIIYCCIFNNLSGFDGVSPFTKTKINISDSLNYSFTISGHFYGNSSNVTGYPTGTITGNINELNQSETAFLICLGDMFLDVTNDIPYYRKALFEPLKKPIFNAVGNHDLSGDIYQKNFGETFYSFQIGNDVHIVLDTEIDNGDLLNEQLKLIEEAKNKTLNADINNVFIYAHRTVFVDSYDELDGLFTDNTQSLSTPNFESDILPILNQFNPKTSIYWFAGSIGGEAPASFFYYTPKENLHFIATAIRGLKRDALLNVHVANGKVNFETQSLTGENLKTLQEYNQEFWLSNTNVQPPFNWRLVPLYFKNTLTHRYFYYGLLSTMGMFLILRIFKKRKKAS